jgi:hypothetical protein
MTMKSKKNVLSLIILIISFFNSFGQISYTNFSPAKTVDYNSGLSIDMNNDSIVDFVFSYVIRRSPCCAYGPAYQYTSILLGVQDTGQIIKNANSGITFNNKDTITQTLDSIICSGENNGSTIVYNSQDCDLTQCSNILYGGLSEAMNSKYFVVKFLINNEYHYGWIKFSKTSGVNIEIQSVAYNTIPEKSFRINDPNPTYISNNLTNDNINVYPNPFKDKVTIELNESRFQKLYLTDMTGKVLFSKDITSGQIILNTEKLLQGAYILKMESDKDVISKLLVK